MYQVAAKGGSVAIHTERITYVMKVLVGGKVSEEPIKPSLRMTRLSISAKPESAKSSDNNTNNGITFLPLFLHLTQYFNLDG